MEVNIKEKMYLNGEDFLILIELGKSSENYAPREIFCNENKYWLEDVIKNSNNYSWKLLLEKECVEKKIYTYSFKTTKPNKWINERVNLINLNYDFMEKFEIIKRNNPLNQFTRKYKLGVTDTLFMISQGNSNILVKRKVDCKNIEEEILLNGKYNCDNNKYIFQLLDVYDNSIKYLVYYNDDANYKRSSLIIELDLPKDIHKKLTQFKKNKNRVAPKIFSYNNLI